MYNEPYYPPKYKSELVDYLQSRLPNSTKTELKKMKIKQLRAIWYRLRRKAKDKQ
jgi:hypothetical protein